MNLDISKERVEELIKQAVKEEVREVVKSTVKSHDVSGEVNDLVKDILFEKIDKKIQEEGIYSFAKGFFEKETIEWISCNMNRKERLQMFKDVLLSKVRDLSIEEVLTLFKEEL